MANDDGGNVMDKLKQHLLNIGIEQVKECETDEDVEVLTIRVMEAMTQAYQTVTGLLDQLTKGGSSPTA